METNENQCTGFQPKLWIISRIINFNNGQVILAYVIKVNITYTTVSKFHVLESLTLGKI